MLGLSYQTFLDRRRDGSIPISPVPYCTTRYDVKQIDQYLDSLLDNKPTSKFDYDAILTERLANRGKVHREISGTTRL